RLSAARQADERAQVDDRTSRRRNVRAGRDRALAAPTRPAHGQMSSRIAEAVAKLAAGEVVAFPTETVYGLGADATNDAAIAKIFALKGRPADHPLIVHIADPEGLDAWARNVPDRGRTLAERFWPGPLPMILEKSPRLPASVTGGQDTVGLRCPSHRIAQELLREFARTASGVVAAPSANKFGHV